MTTWISDPRLPERQVGWIDGEASEYVRPVRRIGVRCRQKNGQWKVAVLLSTLRPETVLSLTGASLEHRDDPVAVLLAYVSF